LELHELSSLLLLNETGSFQETASRRNLTPGAIHQQLKSLEREMGLSLYAKGDGRLVLTDAGRVLLRFAAAMLEQRDAAAAALRDLRIAGPASLRIGAGPNFSTHLLPKLLSRYRKLFPRVDLYVETGSNVHLLAELRSGALDLIFDLAGAVEEDLEHVATWDSVLGFVGSRRFFPARVRLTELTKQPFIAFQSGSRMDRMIGEYLGGLNFHPKIIMRSDSAEAIRSMVTENLGIAVLWVWNINREIHSQTLRLIKTEAEPLPYRMALIRRTSSYTPNAMANFINLARKTSWPHLTLTERC